MGMKCMYPLVYGLGMQATSSPVTTAFFRVVQYMQDRLFYDAHVEQGIKGLRPGMKEQAMIREYAR